jgi:hypothetical protein
MRSCIFLIAVLTTLSVHDAIAQDSNTKANRPSLEFTGTAYDIDYAPDRTQVLIRPAGNPAGVNLVGFVKSDVLQDVLQTSFVASRIVRVTHYDQNIIRVVLVHTPTLCSEPGCVSEIDCSDFGCTAVIVGESDQVRLTDRRTLGVLLTAINDGRRVEELIVNANRIITRVKVNIPDVQERR